jgi:purine nucleosidase
MPTRILLDTDIGTDVDDCLALAVILSSPELSLEGVTCVYGDVALRSRMVRKLLRLRGRGEVPVYLGATQTLLGLRTIYWEGHEGAGLLSDDDPPAPADGPHAVDVLIDTVMASPGEVTILAIGPLTNVALALRKEPRLAQAVAGLTIMGGVARGPGGWHLPFAEHNIICDPEAAHVVFSSGAPIHLVPLDVTTRVEIRPDDVARIRAGGSAYHQAVADQVALYPQFVRRGSTFLHDPLAAAVLVDPSLVSYEPLHVAVETGGRVAAGATLMRAPDAAHPATAQVALAIDVARAEAFMIERIAA